jgi:type IV secretory pathway ATPase VirB11/archaellum biosynthesis ATPase
MLDTIKDILNKDITVIEFDEEDPDQDTDTDNGSIDFDDIMGPPVDRNNISFDSIFDHSHEKMKNEQAIKQSKTFDDSDVS